MNWFVPSLLGQAQLSAVSSQLLSGQISMWGSSEFTTAVRYSVFGIQYSSGERSADRYKLAAFTYGKIHHCSPNSREMVKEGRCNLSFSRTRGTFGSARFTTCCWRAVKLQPMSKPLRRNRLAHT